MIAFEDIYLKYIAALIYREDGKINGSGRMSGKSGGKSKMNTTSLHDYTQNSLITSKEFIHNIFYKLQPIYNY